MRTNEGRLFQAVGAQHENRRAAVLVDEDGVEISSRFLHANVHGIA